jgi:hypothetical protein
MKPGISSDYLIYSAGAIGSVLGRFLQKWETIACLVGEGRTLGVRVIFGAEIQKSGHVNVNVCAYDGISTSYNDLLTALIKFKEKKKAFLPIPNYY